MPRPLRVIESDTICHVLNRSNNKIKIFESSKDYLAFENTLLEAKDKYPMRILSYCLMPNHWHFIMNPEGGNDLTKFMHWLTLTHSQRWLGYRKMVGYGHLYQGRYKSFPIQRDEHFITACRYVERNALRAKLVNRAEDWRWGSAWVRVNGSQKQKNILSPWPVSMPDGYYDLLNTDLSHEEDSLVDIRISVNRGRPFGNLQWLNKIADKLSLSSTIKPKGRPKKGS